MVCKLITTGRTIHLLPNAFVPILRRTLRIFRFSLILEGRSVVDSIQALVQPLPKMKIFFSKTGIMISIIRYARKRGDLEKYKKDTVIFAGCIVKEALSISPSAWFLSASRAGELILSTVATVRF